MRRFEEKIEHGYHFAEGSVQGPAVSFVVTKKSVCVTRVDGSGVRRLLGRCPSIPCSIV